MSYPHRIRLRGPWDYQPLLRLSAGELPPPGRMTLPCRWSSGGLADFAGRVRFHRRFGFPARLDAFERVWLTSAGVETCADVWLNGQFLGRQETAGPFAFEVTALLQVRNELIVEVEGPSTGGLWGETRLEVRCSAYLRGLDVLTVRQGETVRLQVAGEVVGTAERPLELYVLLDGRTIAYGTVEAAPAGQAFQLLSDELAPEQRQSNEPRTLRVDLVNGATVWYQWEELFNV